MISFRNPFEAVISVARSCCIKSDNGLVRPSIFAIFMSLSMWSVVATRFSTHCTHVACAGPKRFDTSEDAPIETTTYT